MFDAYHFHKETTFDTTGSIKLSNIRYNSYKEGYIQSKVGSHIITGGPISTKLDYSSTTINHDAVMTLTIFTARLT